MDDGTKQSFQMSCSSRRRAAALIGLVIVAVAVFVWKLNRAPASRHAAAREPEVGRQLAWEPRRPLDTGGFKAAVAALKPWEPTATLAEVAGAWKDVGKRAIANVDRELAVGGQSVSEQLPLLLLKAMLCQYEGDARRAYAVLDELRSQVEHEDMMAQQALYTIIYFQGVSALRLGENDNCILCRGESSCIIPIAPAAIHTNPEGSRLAIRHFLEYLERFPDDLEVAWLLNLAHMTLGEHPGKVDPRFVISLDLFKKSECDIGRFRDIGHIVGVNRFNQGGGGLMEDFDNDGLLDIVVTTWDATCPMALYHNTGGGRFQNRADAALLSEQLGGVYAVQTDYDNDGFMDIFIVRSPWLPYPVRPTLLRNDGDGTFADVTGEAGLLAPGNSISASWADYDNDGWLDLFVCCETSYSRLYHNLRDGTFEEIASQAGLREGELRPCKASAWIDYDNDGYQDLYLDYLTPTEGGQLFHNRRDGTFAEVTGEMGIRGPVAGFSCWAWDYDNDGWLDIFATSYDRTLVDIVKGLLGEPHSRESNRLFHNVNGRSFENATKEKGLDMVFATMGSNYGDFDNDGFLDIYLGTGDPDFATLIPNRMFKNVEGKRFSEITGSSGTGHLQKGHGVACGDWDRDGDIDLFVETGGPTNGDKFRNILFQNPGQGNHWLTVKLIGRKTNRAAIGARIKVVTAGEKPLTVHRHVSSGSSFGASPLQQTIGLAKAERVALLEVHWPTSGTTQVFRDIAADQAIEVTEFAADYRPLSWKPIPLPE